MRTKKRSRAILLAFVLGLLAIAGTALATPGIGVLSAPVHARGTIEGDESIRRVGWELFLSSFRRGSTTDVVTQQITIAPGGTTGWHGHPGPVFVTVKSGALRIVYADDTTCQGTTYTAGQSFIDFGNVTVHTAYSVGPTPLELWATYLVPGAPGTPFRIDSPNTSSCNL